MSGCYSHTTWKPAEVDSSSERLFVSRTVIECYWCGITFLADAGAVLPTSFLFRKKERFLDFGLSNIGGLLCWLFSFVEEHRRLREREAYVPISLRFFKLLGIHSNLACWLFVLKNVRFLRKAEKYRQNCAKSPAPLSPSPNNVGFRSLRAKTLSVCVLRYCGGGGKERAGLSRMCLRPCFPPCGKKSHRDVFLAQKESACQISVDSEQLEKSQPNRCDASLSRSPSIICINSSCIGNYVMWNRQLESLECGNHCVFVLLQTWFDWEKVLAFV